MKNQNPGVCSEETMREATFAADYLFKIYYSIDRGNLGEAGGGFRGSIAFSAENLDRATRGLGMALASVPPGLKARTNAYEAQAAFDQLYQIIRGERLLPADPPLETLDFERAARFCGEIATALNGGLSPHRDLEMYAVTGRRLHIVGEWPSGNGGFKTESRKPVPEEVRAKLEGLVFAENYLKQAHCNLSQGGYVNASIPYTPENKARATRELAWALSALRGVEDPQAHLPFFHQLAQGSFDSLLMAEHAGPYQLRVCKMDHGDLEIAGRICGMAFKELRTHPHMYHSVEIRDKNKQ